MASPKRIRLSPSGPFVKDGSVNGGDLLAGNGTPGLVWRSQGADPAAPLLQLNGAVLTVLPELSMAFAPADAIPKGYHYDVEVNLWIESVEFEWGALHMAVEVQDAVAGWVAAQNNTGDVVYNYSLGVVELLSETACIHFGNIDLDRTGVGPEDILGVRVRAYAAAGGGTAVPLYSGQLSNMRITQYVQD